MTQLWNDTARNYMDRFWWYLAEIFKSLKNRVCMFQFSCRFLVTIFSYNVSKLGHYFWDRA